MLEAISLFGQGYGQQCAQAAPPTAASGRTQPLVLVIDDDSAVRILARNCLHGFGFEVEEAPGGEKGLEIAARVRPDLILCDVMMPGMNGFEVCTQLRRTPGCEHVPIVMLTGLDDMDSIEQAYSAGATEFIVKPINWGLLPRRVRYIVRASTATEELRRSEERYALAAMGANDGLWDWDLEADKLYLSPRWYELLGETGGDAQSDPHEWLDRVHLDDVERVNKDIAAHLAGDTEQFQSEYRMRMHDGSYRWMLSRGLAVRDANNRPWRFAGSHTDISERKQAEAQLQFDALHDS
ncbi:MAG: response regulator, partial [Gammaproteobacteria bacterium]